MIRIATRTYATAAASVAKPKTHRIRNSIITTVALGASLYGAGIWISMKNDAFHDIFTEYVPYSETLVLWIEHQRFKRRFVDSPDAPLVKSDKLNEKTKVPRAGATWKPVNEPVDVPGAVNVMVPGPHLSAKSTTEGSAATSASSASKAGSTTSAKAPTSSSSSKSTTSTSSSTRSLPLIHLPSGSDPVVSTSVASLNKFIESINSQSFSESSVESLSSELQNLSNSIGALRKSHETDLQKSLESQAAKFAGLSESRSNEIKTAIQAQQEKWSREFHSEQKRIVDLYNQRLAAEIAATKAVVVQHANNRLLAVHADRELKFAKEIADKVAAEREGRLSDLKELADAVHRGLESAGAAIDESDRTAELRTAVAKLNNAISASVSEPIPLAPYFDAIKAAGATDPLIKAAVDAVPSDALARGVLAPAQLSARLKLLEPEIRKASLLPPNSGVAGHFGSWLFSKLLWRKTGAPVGSDVESILARAETSLEQGRVIEAVAEVNSLKGWPKKLAHDWLIDGRTRSEVEFLVEVLAVESLD